MGLQEAQQFMDTPEEGSALETLYEDSVQREREAWITLQSHPPGSIGRARAWEEWSQAIMFTNHAWRRLSAVRLAHPAPQGTAAQQHHARA